MQDIGGGDLIRVLCFPSGSLRRFFRREMCIKGEGEYLSVEPVGRWGTLSKRLPVTAALGALIGSSIIRGGTFLPFFRPVRIDSSLLGLLFRSVFTVIRQKQ